MLYSNVTNCCLLHREITQCKIQKVSLLLPHFVNKKLQLIVTKRSHHTSNDSVSFHYLAKYDVKKKHPVPIQVRWF